MKPSKSPSTRSSVSKLTSFGAFAHPQQPSDRLPEKLVDPELLDPDTRKVASWPGTDVYILYSPPSTICLVRDSNPPWGNIGGSSCSMDGGYADLGTATLWPEDDPDEAQGAVLIPDGATAIIDRGTFIAAGNGVIGVIGVKPTNPQEGIAVILTFPDGHIPPRG